MNPNNSIENSIQAQLAKLRSNLDTPASSSGPASYQPQPAYQPPQQSSFAPQFPVSGATPQKFLSKYGKYIAITLVMSVALYFWWRKRSCKKSIRPNPVEAPVPSFGPAQSFGPVPTQPPNRGQRAPVENAEDPNFTKF